MAHKTFISYKYSDARDLRDRIIRALGSDATYYKGEDGFSNDLSSLKADSIKNYLKGMLFDTTVTIVVISPQMLLSRWIDWEIEYSLCNYTRNGRTSRTNGVVGVVAKDWLGSTSWAKDGTGFSYGYDTRDYRSSALFGIINRNRHNQKDNYASPRYGTAEYLDESYIALVDEDDFLRNPSRYIENAYEKSQRLWDYNISKTR